MRSPPVATSLRPERRDGPRLPVERAVEADGVTIGVNGGEAAGQEIPHVHGHVVPRTDGDGAGALHSLRWPRPEIADDEFSDVADAIGDEL